MWASGSRRGNSYNGMEEPTRAKPTSNSFDSWWTWTSPISTTSPALGDNLLCEVGETWPETMIVNCARADLADRARDVEDGLADLLSVCSLALTNSDSSIACSRTRS